MNFFDQLIVLLNHKKKLENFYLPVENVESTVDAEKEQVVCGDGFRLATLLQHEQLRQDCHRYKIKENNLFFSVLKIE